MNMYTITYSNGRKSIVAADSRSAASSKATQFLGVYVISIQEA